MCYVTMGEGGDHSGVFGENVGKFPIYVERRRQWSGSAPGEFVKKQQITRMVLLREPVCFRKGSYEMRRILAMWLCVTVFAAPAGAVAGIFVDKKYLNKK